MDKFLNCPFCGGAQDDGSILVDGDIFTAALDEAEKRFKIQCCLCGAQTYPTHREDAIRLWNTRAAPEKRAVKLPQRYAIIGMSGEIPVVESDDHGSWLHTHEVLAAITAAGISAQE